MRKREIAARQNPICQQFRDMSTRFSYLIRQRLMPGWSYRRERNNPYRIYLKKGKHRYAIWWFNNRSGTGTPGTNFACVDYCNEPNVSGGLTCDPNLKCCGTFEFSEATIKIAEVLKKAGVIR